MHTGRSTFQFSGPTGSWNLISNYVRIGLQVRFVGRHLKRSDGNSEAARLPCSIQAASGERDAAREFCRRAKTQPDKKTDRKSSQGGQAVADGSLAAQEIASENFCVHAHESDDRAEIEHFGGELVCQHERSNQR